MGNGARVVGDCEELRKEKQFFKFTDFFPRREFPHTKCPGGIWRHGSNTNFTTICNSSGSTRRTPSRAGANACESAAARCRSQIWTPTEAWLG